MNTLKITSIASILLVIAAYLLVSVLGIGGIGFVTTLVFPILVVATHVTCSVALFRETRKRIASGNYTFAHLDPVFWGLAGLTFGILGLLSFRILNDHFTSGANQSG